MRKLGIWDKYDCFLLSIILKEEMSLEGTLLSLSARPLETGGLLSLFFVTFSDVHESTTIGQMQGINQLVITNIGRLEDNDEHTVETDHQ